MRILTTAILFFCLQNGFSQGNPPWEQPLKISWSANGTTFGSAAIYQDSSGVPSLIRWKGDTLVCVFQWFRQPMNSSSWDRVAVKFSFDAGLNWTQPKPIIVSGMPANYQRPFDPALTVLADGNLRIYFSSSNGMPVGGLSSIVDTYSAISSDGVNYVFENGARFDDGTGAVIDPSVIFFNGVWHYAAPSGAPQDGAFHCTSIDGITFTRQAKFISDNLHNWTGNFMINSTTELRFYGSGQKIWYNSSIDGFAWQGYTNTNLAGGDPSVVKTGNTSYLAVYVGQPYSMGMAENYFIKKPVMVYPNPFTQTINIQPNTINQFYELINSCGLSVWKGIQIEKNDFSGLTSGLYFLKISDGQSCLTLKLVKN